MISGHAYRPNGLGAQDENGNVPCARCGLPRAVHTEELLVTKTSAMFLVPPALLADLAAPDMSDLLAKAWNGEIQFKPSPEPRRHRCLFCWLTAKLPGHDRCAHGYLTCEDCYSDW